MSVGRKEEVNLMIPHLLSVIEVERSATKYNMATGNGFLYGGTELNRRTKQASSDMTDPKALYPLLQLVCPELCSQEAHG